MLKELKNGKWAHQIATVEEVNEFVNEAKDMVKKYGWEERTVAPWGYAENVMKTIDYIADFKSCTFSSKQMLITLANGLAKVMNTWEERELYGISIKSVKTGKISKVEKDMVDFYLENGFVRA